jgi:hypothetical protein
VTCYYLSNYAFTSVLSRKIAFIFEFWCVQCFCLSISQEHVEDLAAKHNQGDSYTKLVVGQGYRTGKTLQELIQFSIASAGCSKPEKR